MIKLWEIKQVGGVLGGLESDFIQGNIFSLSEPLGNIFDVSGLIDFASVWGRSQKRGIGFKQNFF